MWASSYDKIIFLSSIPFPPPPLTLKQLFPDTTAVEFKKKQTYKHLKDMRVSICQGSCIYNETNTTSQDEWCQTGVLKPGSGRAVAPALM